MKIYRITKTRTEPHWKNQTFTRKQVDYRVRRCDATLAMNYAKESTKYQQFFKYDVKVEVAEIPDDSFTDITEEWQ